MKILLSFLLLTTIASCGKKSNKNNGNSPKAMMQEYRSNLMSVERGSVKKKTVNKGSVYTLNYTTKVPEKIIVDTQEEEIILKVEGDKVYTYYTYRDQNSTVPTQEVRLSYLVDPDMEDMIQYASTKREGSILHYQIEGASTSGGMDSTTEQIKSEMTEFSKINLQKPFCEMSSETITRNTKHVMANGQSRDLENLVIRSISTCGTLKTDEELKALDLKNIPFCDETTEEYGHCPNRDMSELTADL